MAYNKTNWENSPSTNTPINNDNLNKMEQGIYENSLMVEDTGWVNMSQYINSTNFTVRSGYEPYARKIGKTVYWIGEIYCSTSVGSNVVTLLSSIPTQFRPTYQYASSGCRYATSNVYNMFIGSNGNINVSEGSNINSTADFQGYQLGNISGYLVD